MSLYDIRATAIKPLKEVLKASNISPNAAIEWIAYKQGVPYDFSLGAQKVSDIPEEILNASCFEKEVKSNYKVIYKVETEL